MTKQSFESKYPFVFEDKYGCIYYVLKSKSIRTGKEHIGFYKSRSYAQSKNNCYQDQILIGFDIHRNEIYRKYYSAKQ